MACLISNLLGPPELYTGAAVQQPQAPSPTPSTFMNSMVANFNSVKVQPPPLKLESKPPMGYTENRSPTFLSSGDPCLDFFFHVVPNTPPENIKQRLEQAWTHDPLTTLKLICNLRGVRGTGKSDKESYYTSALWLHGLHPKTLTCNLQSLADFGYYKDMPEVLFRLLEQPRTKKQRKTRISRNKSVSVRKRGVRVLSVLRKNETEAKRKERALSREDRDKAVMEKGKEEEETARVQREERRLEMAKKALERYECDPDYRFLHDRISDLFASRLKSDLRHLNSCNFGKISLAAKWCPSLDSSFDRSTLLCEGIARRIFPRSDPQYQGLEEAHYAYRVRDRLRKEVLVPLRRALQLPEVYMSDNRWSDLPYTRVASIAMKTYKEIFSAHDEARFKEYLESAKSGKAKIASGALLPHEIVSSLEDADGGQVAELQWRSMVEDLSRSGKMKNCIAVCDVSGSMWGTPMDVCVALGILVSELSEEPWKGKVITFSESPTLHTIKGGDLRSKVEFVTHMEWGMNTDFQKVFDQILQVAVNGKLMPEDMIKRIFVFSDMEFDCASGDQFRRRSVTDNEDINSWETDYEAIKRKFRERGYENAVPEIVFWNLRDSPSTPVSAKETGVALVSGFSKNALKLFMDDGEIPNPEAVMEAAISGEEYEKLLVVD